MTFVDTNVFMYAVGRPHPLRVPAREFLAEAARAQTRLCTSDASGLPTDTPSATPSGQLNQ